MVGYGNGAQFAGQLGRKMKTKGLFGLLTLKRIVAIEPNSKAISSTDATFVMTIHTEDSISDTNVEGHANFYINGGVDQPKCGNFFLFYWLNKRCSYVLAQKFWIEAVKSNSATIFPAKKCNSYNDFEKKTCSATDPVGYMNLKTDTNLRGKYYLNTNNESPYAKATADP